MLEDRLELNVNIYFRYLHTIETEGYELENNLDKDIPVGKETQQENIENHWLHQIEDYIIRNEHYKDDDKGGYAIILESFDIEGVLWRPHIIKADYKSLQTICLQQNITSVHNNDMIIEEHRGEVPTTDETDMSAFTID